MCNKPDEHTHAKKRQLLLLDFPPLMSTKNGFMVPNETLIHPQRDNILAVKSNESLQLALPTLSSFIHKILVSKTRLGNFAVCTNANTIPGLQLNIITIPRDIIVV